MKKLILLASILLLMFKLSMAQCDTRTVVESTKQEMIDASGQVADQKEESVSIEFRKDTIMLRNTNNSEPITALVKESTCEWKQAFKNGKGVYKVEYTYPNGSTGKGSIEIEGKEGVITVHILMERLGDRKIRVVVSKFEERK